MMRSVAGLVIAFCALAASRVDAALMHADVMGATVNFTNIVEDSPSGDPLPLFGQPAWAGGNSIDFDPSGNFSAVSQNGGADVTDGKLTLMVRAKPGFSLESLGLLETGLVTLLNLGGNDPFAAVTGLVDIDVVEVDGGAIQQVNLPPLSLTYSPSNGDFQHSVDAAGPLYSSPWTGTLAVDLDAALTAAGIGYTFGATKINITLNNRLLAATGALGSIAIIDKKDFDITVTTEPVPEPATALLMLAASLGVLLLRERCRWN